MTATGNQPADETSVLRSVRETPVGFLPSIRYPSAQQLAPNPTNPVQFTTRAGSQPRSSTAHRGLGPPFPADYEAPKSWADSDKKPSGGGDAPGPPHRRTSAPTLPTVEPSGSTGDHERQLKTLAIHSADPCHPDGIPSPAEPPRPNCGQGPWPHHHRHRAEPNRGPGRLNTPMPRHPPVGLHRLSLPVRPRTFLIAGHILDSPTAQSAAG